MLSHKTSSVGGTDRESELRSEIRHALGMTWDASDAAIVAEVKRVKKVAASNVAAFPKTRFKKLSS